MIIITKGEDDNLALLILKYFLKGGRYHSKKRDESIQMQRNEVYGLNKVKGSTGTYAASADQAVYEKVQWMIKTSYSVLMDNTSNL